MSGCNKPIEVNGRYFSCGNCMACRISRSREWSTRLIYELTAWNYNAIFITLTYDDEHLPIGETLVKSDLQKFFKRLRKDLALENRKIKYFACGEYGDTKGRPHYHAIVFGMSYNEHDRQLIKDNWRLCSSLRFDGSEDGFQPVHNNNINYVTGYIRKKLNGKMALEQYGDNQPPFQCSSQGLGLEFAKTEIERMSKRGYITRNGVKMSIPRYFIKKFDLNTKTTERRSEITFQRIEKIQELEPDFSYQLACESAHGNELPSDIVDREYFKLKAQNLLQNELNQRRKLEISNSKNKL